ncbi:hypothetical protein PV08_02602 [Exophiala spinifera]|uniref:Uncharacterized protein n=1 Tax=Exophiala spinifera TaxID=91928 RepID=A0A0D2C3U5_9EURO|nr:uncharacterized protein PV08_02602 [Exophiala spinifera]KIW18314.1 hypothetical protein PV08_02602 [Exophiala spinifera]
MTDKIHHAADQVIGSIDSGMHRIHGAGDVVRGTAMEALDKLLHSREGEERDREIAQRGRAEMETAGEWERERGGDDDDGGWSGSTASATRTKLHAHSGRPRSRSGGGGGIGEGSHLAQSRIRTAENASNLSSPHTREEGHGAERRRIGSEKGDELKAARLAMRE